MSKENTAVTKKKMKRCKEDVVFDAACFIILTLVLFVVAYPLYWVIISSISAPSAVSSGKVLLHPIGFTLKGYAEVFKNDQVMRGFLNSLIITFCGIFFTHVFVSSYHRLLPESLSDIVLTMISITMFTMVLNRPIAEEYDISLLIRPTL